MTENVDHYHDILQENFYLLSRYLLPEDFLDTLLSDNVINMDEKEVIMNHFVNQNRRQRASKCFTFLIIDPHVFRRTLTCTRMFMLSWLEQSFYFIFYEFILVINILLSQYFCYLPWLYIVLQTSL